ncbi:tRNA (guanosine(46)-N7)-methyltransferase TrmB [Evtepia sp.]|uniref:tRNA (guanosine(46)-N7)-methyltransferase TrmB n=1 Tax=Evtepia sp. TaxID=2773933 RepID=UPI003F16137E
MRMRRKKNLGPRMEACAAWQIKDPKALRGNWRSLMPGAKELRLELGCGKGRFTCQTAAANPEILFVAVERVPDAMVMAMEKARNMGLTNVFYVDADAALLPEFFAPEEVDLIYINFCDPWPPKRHAKRRLTHRNFLKLYREVLKERGQIHFKTDNAPLFEFSILEFPEAGYDLEEVTRDLHANGVCGIMTDYEEKFHNLGTRINRCVGIKGELPPQPEGEEEPKEPAEA